MPHLRSLGVRGRPPRAIALAFSLMLLLTIVPLGPVEVQVASAQGVGPGNLLRNPSFERSYDEPNFGPRPYHWSIDPFPPPDGSSIHQVTEVHRDGFHSAMVSSPDAPPGQELMWYQRLEVGDGGALGMGGWVRADLGPGAKVVLRVRFGNFYSDPASTWELFMDWNSTGWTRLQREPEHVTATERVYFQCVLSGPGTVWFDDMWLGQPSVSGNPPFIISVPPLDAAVGVEYTYRARAVDMEGDVLSFDLYRGPSGMTVSEDGDVNWTPMAVPEEAVKVVLRATDGNGLVSYQDFFLRVAETPVERPVHAFLYSTHDDPFNDGISSDRYDVLVDMLGYLRRDYLDAPPTVNVLLSGTDLLEAGPELGGTIEDLRRLDGAGVDIGYTAFHEPTYDTNPLYDASYGSWDWVERVEAINGLLSRGRDPLTGEVIATKEGGLELFTSTLGDPSSVAGVGTDGAQLHALDRYPDSALVLGIEDGPHPSRPLVVNPNEGSLAAMLAEDPSSPYGAYWQGGSLHLALDEVGIGPVMARNGAVDAELALETLDRRRVNVLPVVVMDRSTYCNASKVVGGDQVLSPTEWGYSHPTSPGLPEEAVFGPAERQAFYEATCATLEWMAGEALPGAGGTFLSPYDVEDMVDPGTGIVVSAAELATAADDLLVRRNELYFPDWVGISWGYCRGDYQYFSLADMYGLLVQALAAYGDEGSLPATVELGNVLGPRGEAPPSQPWNRVFMDSILEEAARQAEALTGDKWRADPHNVVPPTSVPGGVEVNAMEFLLLMAATYMVLFEGDVPANPLVNLLPTAPWPVTRLVLEAEGRRLDTGDSWTLKPASANQQVDEEPPQVRYATPSDGSVNVPLTENVTVTFSERMDETMDLEGTVTLYPPVEAELRWLYHRLVLDPVGNLTENTTYTARVGTDLRDAAGNRLMGEVEWSFTTTGAPNLPPVLTPLPEDPEVEVEENKTVRFSLFVEDEGPFPLSIEWWLDGVRVVGENADQFVHRPSHTDAGDHIVTVVVSDAAEPPGVSTFTWNLTVLNVNVAPVLLGTTPGEGDVTDREAPDGTLRFSVSAEDPDEGVLTFAWEVDDRSVDEGHLSDGGALFSFPLDHDSAGEHAVVCRVEDRAGEGFWVRWTLTVEDVNRPPMILGIEPALPPTVETGRSVRVTVNATDPDGDDLSYKWSVDGLVAAETGSPEWSFSSNRDGSFSITVTVEDGRGGNASADTAVNVLPETEPRTQPEPSAAVWVLVLVMAAAIGLALLWPRLRRGLEGD